MNFQFQFNPRLLQNLATGFFDQSHDILSRCMSEVDDMIAVNRGDFRIPATLAAQAGGIDQLPGALPFGIFEYRSGIGPAYILYLAAALQLFLADCLQFLCFRRLQNLL